jgi:histidinol-phosphate/aromatic aminotransferase/cobyric acid decarboxylase-like protein
LFDGTQIPLPPISALTSGYRAVDGDVVSTLSAVEEALARGHKTSPDRIWVTHRPWSRLSAEILSDGDRVVVAEPSRTEFVTPIVDAGARYIDAGRNSRFQIDSAGWDCALAQDGVKVAYLCSPEVPTGGRPSAARIRDVVASGAILVLDERAAVSPASPLALMGDSVVIIRSVRVGAGASELCPDYCVGPPSVIERLKRRSRAPLSEQGLREMAVALGASGQVRARLQAWKRTRNDTYRDLVQLNHCIAHRPYGIGIWVQVAGVASAHIARGMTNSGVVGDKAWTWRDGVLVRPVARGRARQDLLDALSLDRYDASVRKWS